MSFTAQFSIDPVAEIFELVLHFGCGAFAGEPQQGAQLGADREFLPLMCEHDAGVTLAARELPGVKPAEMANVEAVQHSSVLRGEFQMLLVRAGNEACLEGGSYIDAVR